MSDRCKHGVLFPHECSECQNEVTNEDVLRARIAELEREVDEQSRLNGMGSEREAALMGKLAAAQATIDMMAEAITELMYASTDKAHQMAHTALARRGSTKALDAMLAEAEKRGEQRAAGMQKAYERFSDAVDRQAAERSE